MPVTAEFAEDPRRIDLVYSGAITQDDLRRGVAEGIALAREHDTWRVVADTSTATSDPTVFALFDVVNELAALGVTEDLARRYREVVVTAPGGVTAEGAKFYEDAMVNRGLVARLYDDRAAALAWLATQPL